MKLVFETSRLIIRPYQLKDFEKWRRAYGQMLPAQNAWDINPRKREDLSLALFKKNLRDQKHQRRQETFYDFAVFLKVSGELIGTIGLMDIVRGVFQNAYLGYRLFNKHWNQGYGKEMVKASFQIAFEELELHRIEAGIDPKNRRSILLARSLGMRKEGLKKRALYINQKWQDIVMYSLTCEDLKYKFKGDMKSFSVRLR